MNARISFDLELAKKVTNNEIEGEILTNNGDTVRIVEFNSGNIRYPIIALVKSKEDDIIRPESFTNEGVFNSTMLIHVKKLCLRVPEHYTFKKGDVLYGKTYKEIFDHYTNESMFNFSVQYAISNGHFALCDTSIPFGTSENWILANEEQKSKMNDALGMHGYDLNDDGMIFKVEKEKEPEFKPKDWVLVRNTANDTWELNVFSRIKENNVCKFRCIWNSFIYCIPYEGNEHLLGTCNSFES